MAEARTVDVDEMPSLVLESPRKYVPIPTPSEHKAILLADIEFMLNSRLRSPSQDGLGTACYFTRGEHTDRDKYERTMQEFLLPLATKYEVVGYETSFGPVYVANPRDKQTDFVFRVSLKGL